MQPLEQSPSASPPKSSPHWLCSLIGIPLATLGGFASVIFGFWICAYFLIRAGGGPPDARPFIFFLAWLVLGAAPSALAIFLLQSSQFTGRSWKRAMAGLCVLALIAGIDANYGPNNWHALFRSEKFASSDVESLKTTITPHLEAQIKKGKNLLWCGTFQLAWNEACDLTGGDLQFIPAHPMATALNRRTFKKDYIDNESYVAMAGFMGSNIHAAIEKVIDTTFAHRFHPRLLPIKSLTPRPQDIVAYACLYKNLRFAIPFERFDQDLTFGGIKVRSFGFIKGKAAGHQMYPQVLILDYQNQDDFVIELKTTSGSDRVVLAKVEPPATLENLVRDVMVRSSSSQGEHAKTNDTLMVPRVKFDLTKNFSEIEGKWLIPANQNIAKDLILQSAMQSIWFEMNEKGVELDSEAHMAFACSAKELIEPEHVMVFDKPFLILLQRANSPWPYFALWVENPELLIRW